MEIQQAELPEITAWRRRLEDLYADIRTWVAEMKSSPMVETRSITLNERRSGEYEIPALLIRRGEGEFWVRPIAKWVVGADGRVDLIGGDGPFTLVWMLEKAALIPYETKAGTMGKIEDVDKWFWVDDRPPWHRIELTGDLFRGLAETCLE